MSDLLTTQQAGIAAILAGIALVLNGLYRVVVAGGEHVGPIGKAIAEAIVAWTRRTSEERDCAPKLAALQQRFDRVVAGLLERIEELERAIDAAGHDEHPTTHIVEARGDEATGGQRLPAGVPPRSRRRSS